MSNNTTGDFKGHPEMRFSDKELHRFYTEFKTHVEQTKLARELDRKFMLELQESSQGLIEAWEAIKGTIKVFSVIGKFSLWIVSLTGIIIILDWLRNYFSGGNS